MAALKLQKYLEKNTIKHPTALLHFERQLTDFEQGVLFLCVHIVAKTERAADGFYYLNKSLVRTVMRQEGNQDYARINDAVRVVSKTDLQFNFLGEDRTFDDYQAPLIIGRATNRKRGVIAFEVHPRIEKLIKDPRVFARLNIYFISALADVKRGYSLYALFKDFVDRTKSSEVTIDYWELRTYLGIEESTYKEFKLFKRKVLKPLMDAVNERTDLHLSYVPVKTGRKLSHLKFTIIPQSWQLQLFEAEHAERMVAELGKTFDGALIESHIAPEIAAETPPEDGSDDQADRKRLTDICVKLGVTSKTVARAFKAHGTSGVGEIVALTQSKLARMDKKGDSYDPANYLAKMLNDGIGVKPAQARAKEAEVKRKLAAFEAATQAKADMDVAETALNEKFTAHQLKRAKQLLAQRSADDLALLGDKVAASLPEFGAYRAHWDTIKRNHTRLDLRKVTDKTIFRAYVVKEVLTLWGDPEDMDFASYRATQSVSA